MFCLAYRQSGHSSNSETGSSILNFGDWARNCTLELLDWNSLKKTKTKHSLKLVPGYKYPAPGEKQSHNSVVINN